MTATPAKSGGTFPRVILLGRNPDGDLIEVAVDANGNIATIGDVTVGDVAADFGAPITGEALEAGGTGNLGWVSSVRKAITDRFGTLGQKTMAGSTPVTMASNQPAILVNASGTAIPVTDNSGSLTVDDGGGSLTVDGPLTDTQLRATAVPVSSATLATAAKQDLLKATQDNAYTVLLDMQNDISGLAIIETEMNAALSSIEGTSSNASTALGESNTHLADLVQNTSGIGLQTNGTWDGLSAAGLTAIAKYIGLKIEAVRTNIGDLNTPNPTTWDGSVPADLISISRYIGNKIEAVRVLLASAITVVGRASAPDTAVIPAISTSPAYSAGDNMGGLINLGAVMRANNGNGVLDSITLIDHSAQTLSLTLTLFSRSPGATFTDNTAMPTLSRTADCPYIVTSVTIYPGEWSPAAGGTMVVSKPVGIRVAAGNSQDHIFMAIQVNNTPTMGNVADLLVNAGFGQN